MKKAGKSQKKATCVYEGEYVHMKRKSEGFWLKLMGGGPLQKRLENHEKRNLCVWGWICAHEGKKCRCFTKTDRGSPMEKPGKSQKTQLVFMKGNMRTKWVFLPKTDRESPRKKAGNHQNSNLCVWREYVHMKWKSEGFWLKLMGGPPRKRVQNHEKQLVFMKGTSPCWCLELYHASIADVLSCITLLLLMPWAVSRFPCWYLDL